jgi:endonuclease YncB( thermonuclease family)
MRWRNVANQWATVIVLLLIVAMINHFYPDLATVQSKPEKQQRGGTYDATDGDSFSLGRTEIRLHGIDAPEYRQTCKDASGKMHPCGKMARDELSKLIRGRKIVCKTIEWDRYGRQVSVCKDGDLDINREMVRLGWAMAYRKHALNYVSAESEARKAKRGIWAWDFETPQDYRNRSRAVEGSLGGFKDE